MTPLDKPRILVFREFVPDRIRFWLLILITLVFLFSGTVQLASITQQVGLFAFMDEDARMMGYAAFVGMNMIFPILFAIRFRYSTKTILSVVIIALITCHIATLYTTNVPLLCLINFIAGTFRMLGAFETMVCAQLTITPSRNYAIFYATIFFIVQGSALLFSTQTAYLMDYLSWRHVHWIVIILLLWSFVGIRTLFRHYYSMKKIPLYGIDWAGYALWCSSLLLLLYIATYGKYYEWFSSGYIRLASLLFFLTLLLNVYHMHHIKRPYISLETWKYKNLWKLVILFLALYVSLATVSSLQAGYMASILHYDPVHIAHLNWISLIGMAVSAILCYYWFVKYKQKIKPMIFIGYGSVVLYLLYVYLIIDPGTNFEMFYLPSFLRGFGLLLLYIVLTLYVANIVPFKHNFQALCIIGFIRMSVGTAIGASLIDNWMHYITVKNSMILGGELDAVNPLTHSMGISFLNLELNTQVFMLSMKEIYGWMLSAGILVLFIILFEKEIRQLNLYYPKMRTIRRLFKRERKQGNPYTP